MFSHQHIVITRPIQQAAPIQQRLLAQGAQVTLFPLLEIKALDSADVGLTIAPVDGLIFISPNAVKYAQSYLSALNLDTVMVAAIGKKTADTLQHYGIQADIVPQTNFNTESFLQLSAMQHVQAQRWIIFRGQGGRELLARTLRQRGAQVQYAEVYQRICPALSSESLKQQWQQQKLDRIVITSSEALVNLYTISQGDWIKAVPLLLGSPRMQTTAKQLHHQGNIIVARNPSDDAMLERLAHWVQQESIS